MTTPPPPSKRPFGSPLTDAMLPYFCHPRIEVFRQAVRHPADGLIHAASGFIAIRCRTGRWFPEEFPAPSGEWLARTAELPWGKFDPDPAGLVTEKDGVVSMPAGYWLAIARYVVDAEAARKKYEALNAR